ncbi:universal stress protein [Marinococcus halophilus]|uniref:universal stress protein n=1 Tax=Marinococcus halophilus TaxID=1371 RepID=UPI0009A6D35E|nr:universal stress protein [Marinococcus halophilus]OZT79946.1 universal stress protein [Marinococcus halophilus]
MALSRYEVIIVAVDGSDESRTAFKKSVEIAQEQQAKLIISHVIDTRTFATMERYDRTIIARAEEYGNELLENYTAEAENAGVPDVVSSLEFGSPKTKIPRELAKNYEADLIITGATGLNAVERVFIGSVSEAIARHAKCDVLIVRK